jgi:hypothetical protein
LKNKSGEKMMSGNRANFYRLAALIAVMLVFIFFIGCSKKEANAALFIPDATGKISIDNGITYDENLKNIVVGKQFYLKFEIAVKTSSRQSKTGGNKNLIPFSIAIPATEIFDCTLTDYDGTISAVPLSDTFNNVTRYDFKTLASDAPQKAAVIFQCKALEAGNQRILLTYGSQVNEIYIKTMTLVYIDPAN